MSYFIPLFVVAIVFYMLGRWDYKGFLKFQRDVITDSFDRESVLMDDLKKTKEAFDKLYKMNGGLLENKLSSIDIIHELKSEIVTLKSMTGK